VSEQILEIAASDETGKLGIMHLKRYLDKSLLKRMGLLQSGAFHEEWITDTTVLKVLGIGLEQAMVYVYHNTPSFDRFENWIIETGGMPDADTVAQFNRLLTEGHVEDDKDLGQEDVLNGDDLDFWEQNGYVIIRNAISKEASDQTVELICDHLGIKRYDANTWYNEHPSRQGIMVQFFQHPLLAQNRRSPKIKRAFEQLWQRTDIWVNTDRVGFNPPENLRQPFQGPRLHWDVSIRQPIPFGTQGILYLADTAENQGAFTLVPGFQHKIGDWLKSLPEGADPRKENLYALGPKPIAANAGDFILWHQALPHGSSPNTSALPRFVQYINYEPADQKEDSVWL